MLTGSNHDAIFCFVYAPMKLFDLVRLEEFFKFVPKRWSTNGACVSMQSWCMLGNAICTIWVDTALSSSDYDQISPGTVGFYLESPGSLEC